MQGVCITSAATVYPNSGLRLFQCAVAVCRFDRGSIGAGGAVHVRLIAVRVVVAAEP